MTREITNEELSSLESMSWKLHSLRRCLEGFASDGILSELDELIDLHRQGLGRLRQEDDARSELLREAWDLEGFRSVWSATELGLPHDETPYTAAQVLVYHADDITVEQPIRGNTLRDLYEAADAAIRQSGDGHHVFIEAFTPEGNQLNLHTGS